jgi:hypothetical protein
MLWNEVASKEEENGQKNGRKNGSSNGIGKESRTQSSKSCTDQSME